MSRPHIKETYQITQIIEEMMGTTEKLTSSAKELVNLSGSLEGIISRFKFRKIE